MTTFVVPILKLQIGFSEKSQQNHEIANSYRENPGLEYFKNPRISKIRENPTRENPGFPVYNISDFVELTGKILYVFENF